MIYLLFSTQSAGSTFVQTKIADHIEVVRRRGETVRNTEISLLDWGSYFVWHPNETIDFEPCRTHNPTTGYEVSQWRENYREYLSTNANFIGRDFFDYQAGDWYSVERFFLEQIVGRMQQEYGLPSYSTQNYRSRLDYVIDLFWCISKKGNVFGKNPKFLNDFSGCTVRLLDALMDAGIPIKGILLQRCPLNTFTSILERKFRLDEMFRGDIDQYEEFVFDALGFSITSGLDLADRYDFLRLRYENLGQEFSELLDYLEIPNEGVRLENFRRKYHRRYVLNPRARARYPELKKYAQKLGYDRGQYPKKLGSVVFLVELLGTLVRAHKSHRENVNNPEKPWGILKKVFWLEVQTPRFALCRKVYRTLKKRLPRG